MKSRLVLAGLMVLFSQSCLGQVRGLVGMNIGGPVQYVVTDSLGRITGMDPRTGQEYDEIPNTAYGLGCCGSVDPGDTLDETSEFTFLDAVSSPTFREKYTVEVIGTGLGMYTGVVILSQTKFPGYGFEVKGVINSLQTIFYKITYSTDSTQIPTLRKVVDTITFRQDLNNCYHLNLVRSPVYENLATEIRKVDSLLALGDTLGTIRELLQFENLLDQAWGDTTKIMPDGYKILKEDASMLITALNAWRGTIRQSTTWSNTVYVVADVEITRRRKFTSESVPPKRTLLLLSS